MTAGTLSQILGAILLVSVSGRCIIHGIRTNEEALLQILLPWFMIAVACVSVLYYWAAIFYRWSARELKVGHRFT